MSEVKKNKSVVRKLIPLFIILGLLVLFIAPPVVLVGMLYDGRTNTTTYEETTVEEIGSKAFIRGLNNISDDGKLAVAINKNDINGVIAKVLKEQTNLKGVNNIYVIAKEDSAVVFLEAGFGPLKTRVSITTTFDVSGERFALAIKQFKIGMIAVKRDNAMKALELIGVKVQDNMNLDKFVLDIKKWEISIEKEVLYNTLKQGSGQNSFVGSFFDMVIDNELISFDAGGFNVIDMTIDLEKLHNNQYLTNDDDHLLVNKPSSPYATLGVDEIKAEIDSKMSKLISYAPVEDYDDLFKFLFTGYANSPEAIQNKIATFDNLHHDVMEEIGIPNFAEYKSYGDTIKENAGSILGNLNAQVSYESIDSKKLCKLNEKDINNYLRGQGALGFGDVVYRKSDNMKPTDYAFFLIDNLYCNIVDNKIYFVIGLNINGYETNLVLALSQDNSVSTDPNKTYFTIDNIYFGQVDGQSLLDILFPILTGNMPENELIGFETFEDKPYFYFDVSTVVAKINEFDSSITADNVTLTAVGENLESEGYIAFEID